jgi:hypothetical protein
MQNLTKPISIYERIVLDCQKGDISRYLHRQMFKYSDNFSPTQLAILLNSLARQNYNDRELLFCLTSKAVEKADTFQPFQLGLVLNACTRLSFTSDRLFEAFAPLAKRHLASDAPINAQTCALVFGAFAKKNYVDKSFSEAFGRRVQKLLNDQLLSVVDSAALLHCLSSADISRRELGDLVWKLAQRVADEPSPSPVSVALLAIGNCATKVGLRSGTLQALVDFTGREIGIFSISQIGNVMNGLGNLTQTFTREMQIVISADFKGKLQSRLEKESDNKIPHSTLVHIYSACSKIHGDWTEILQNLTKQVDFNFLSPQGLSVVLNALSLYNIKDFELQPEIISKTLAGHESSQSVSLVLLSLARLERYEDVRMVAEQHIQNHTIYKFSLQSLCNSLYALSPAVAFLSEARRVILVDKLRLILEHMAIVYSGISLQARTQVAISGFILTDDELSSLSVSCLRWLAGVTGNGDLAFKASPSDLHRDVRKFVSFPLLEEICVGPFSVDMVLEI